MLRLDGRALLTARRRDSISLAASSSSLRRLSSSGDGTASAARRIRRTFLPSTAVLGGRSRNCRFQIVVDLAKSGGRP